MHKVNDASVELREHVFEYARTRMNYDPAPLDSPRTEAELLAQTGQTITEAGLGGQAALDLFGEVLAPATISTDHPGYLSFIPCAPTEASKLFDLIVSASAIYGGSWMEGAGAVFAENQVLSWLAAEAGLPESAGGVFVQGGTLGNLSALVAARYKAKAARIASGQPMPASWKFICSSEAHSSLKAAAAVMDVEIIKAPVDAFGKLQGSSVAEAIANAGDGVFAVVATGGTTNFGIVDNLDSVGQAAKAAGLWFHVDGAYGLAGMLAPSTNPLFKGLDRADSFIVDPHKWLYAPFDACALVYRDPEDGRKAHTQHGEYLDILTETGDWNPSDYAYNLTRRPRGLPLWFSLATHGVEAYREAIETNNRVARQIAEVIRATEGLELVRDPELSVVVFVKQGWQLAEYEAWSTKLLERGQAFVVPSSHNGQPNARFAIVNPQTTVELLVAILNSMDE